MNQIKSILKIFFLSVGIGLVALVILGNFIFDDEARQPRPIRQEHTARAENGAHGAAIPNDQAVFALNSYGCRSEEESELIGKFLYEKDALAYARALSSGIDKGDCVTFNKGDAVIDEGGDFAYLKVRRKGDPQEYWVDRGDLLQPK